MRSSGWCFDLGMKRRPISTNNSTLASRQKLDWTPFRTHEAPWCPRTIWNVRRCGSHRNPCPWACKFLDVAHLAHHLTSWSSFLGHYAKHRTQSPLVRTRSRTSMRTYVTSVFWVRTAGCRYPSMLHPDTAHRDLVPCPRLRSPKH